MNVYQVSYSLNIERVDGDVLKTAAASAIVETDDILEVRDMIKQGCLDYKLSVKYEDELNEQNLSIDIISLTKLEDTILVSKKEVKV